MAHQHENEDVTVEGSASAARLLLELSSQWPSLKFMSFGCYYAWIWLSYNSDILFTGLSESAQTGSFLSLTYLFSTAALAFGLFLFGVLRKRLEPLLDSTAFVLGMSLAASVATGGLAACAGTANHGALYACSIITGICTSCVCLRIGMVYARALSRRIIMHTAASFVFACLLYFVATGVPHALGVVFTIVLPACSAFLTMLPDAEEQQVSEETGPERGSAEGKRIPLGTNVRLMVAIGVFALVFGFTRGSSVGFISSGSLNEQGSIIVFGTACVAAIVYLLAGVTGFDFDVDRLYYPVLLLAAAGTLLTPLLGVTSALQAQILGISYALFILVIWSLLSYIAQATGAPVVQVFGLGRGASALGTTVGWAIGRFVFSADATSASDTLAISLAMAFAIVVVALLVFNERSLGLALHTLSERSSGALDTSGVATSDAASAQGTGCETDAGAHVAGCVESGEGDTSGDESLIEAAVRESHPRGGGMWVASCNEIALRYKLTAREREVLFLLAKGNTIESVSQALSVSFNTAKTHIRHVYVKTGVHTRQELITLIERTKSELG